MEYICLTYGKTKTKIDDQDILPVLPVALAFYLNFFFLPFSTFFLSIILRRHLHFSISFYSGEASCHHVSIILLWRDLRGKELMAANRQQRPET